MNFTREPIIETVITSRDGMKLLLRNSKGGGQEDYYVDAVEVVSFGHSFFFRSLERPKSFLVPVSDYEILEVKEMRMALKNVSSERSIKIGGGKEVRPPREAVFEEREPPVEGERVERAPDRQPERAPDRLPERKRDKRRRGRRGGGRHESNMLDAREPTAPGSFPPDGSPSAEMGSGEHKSPSFISKLFPPPPTLIKETLSRYKSAETIGEEVLPRSEEKLDEEMFDTPRSSESKTNEDEETTFED